MYRHRKSCKSNEQILIPKNKYETLVQRIETLENNKNKQSEKLISDILIELQYYRNKKSEKFYQMLLESYLGGTHKRLSCGITDITTDSCHAEIKEWSSWKEAVGQLTCYNIVDPKPMLAMYMFGRYGKIAKQEAINVAKQCNIQMYEFRHVEDTGNVDVVNLSDETTVYSYKPSVT